MKNNIKNLNLCNMTEDDLYVIFCDLKRELQQYQKGTKAYRDLELLIISIKSIVADRYQLSKGNPFGETPLINNPSASRFFS